MALPGLAFAPKPNAVDRANTLELIKRANGKLGKEQKTDINIVSKLEELPKDKSYKLSGVLTLDTSSTLAPGASSSAGEGYSQSGLYRLDAQFSLPQKWAVTTRLGYSKEYSYVLPDGSDGGFIDTGLGMTKAWGEVVKNLELSSSLNLTFPTSKDSHQAGMKSAVGLGFKSDLKIKRFDFILGPSITQLFHEYITQDNGKLNVERSVKILLEIDYLVTERLSVSTSFIPIHSWTYLGTTRDKYILDYELDYKISNTLSLAIGLLTDASALKDNGIDYNYTFYDQNQTAGYFDLAVSL